MLLEILSSQNSFNLWVKNHPLFTALFLILIGILLIYLRKKYPQQGASPLAEDFAALIGGVACFIIAVYFIYLYINSTFK